MWMPTANTNTHRRKETEKEQSLGNERLIMALIVLPVRQIDHHRSAQHLTKIIGTALWQAYC